MLLGLLVMLVPLVSFMLLSVASFAEADSSESLSASRTSFRPDAAAAAAAFVVGARVDWPSCAPICPFFSQQACQHVICTRSARCTSMASLQSVAVSVSSSFWRTCSCCAWLSVSSFEWRPDAECESTSPPRPAALPSFSPTPPNTSSGLVLMLCASACPDQRREDNRWARLQWPQSY